MLSEIKQMAESPWRGLRRVGGTVGVCIVLHVQSQLCKLKLGHFFPMQDVSRVQSVADRRSMIEKIVANMIRINSLTSSG